MGFASSYVYAWDAAIKSVGGVAAGGWRKTSIDATGRATIDETDLFNRTTSHTDLGGRVFNYAYNYAGWLTQQTGSNGQDISYGYYANGYLKSITDNAEHTLTSYMYDKAGNRTYEAYSRTVNGQTEYLENASIEYDEENRVKRIEDLRADIRYEYDAVGNRRRVLSYYHDGVDGSHQMQDYWYAYDSMNRFTVTMGQLSSPNNTRAASEGDTSIKVVKGGLGGDGVEVHYDLVGERSYTVTARDGHREDYTYSAQGYLEDTYISGDPTVQDGLAARRVNDLLGRTTHYEEFKNGSSSFVRNTVYDADNRQQTETGTDGTKTYYYYGHSNADGSDNTDTVSGNGAGELARVQVVSGTLTTNTWTSYEYWDEAKQSTITLKARSTDKAIDNDAWKPGLSKLDYDLNGHLVSARDVGKDAIAGTSDDVTFDYVTNAQGMVLRRVESTDWNPTAEHRYLYVNDAAVGDIGNDGDVHLDYAQTLAGAPASREAMYKSWTPISSADFDQNYQPINRDYPSQTSSSYTAKTGDTLYSIAAAVWGDSSMWYLIADANGLDANADLEAGQVLRIPNKVTNIHNNSTTMRPYNAGERIGDISPTLPDAPAAPIPGKHGGCGGMAKLVVAVVAVVATIYTAGLAAEAMSIPAVSGMGAMEAGATVIGGAGEGLGLAASAVGGALGNVAGQLTGMGLGVQDRFSWGSVATSALSSMTMARVPDIGAAVGVAAGNSPILNAAVNGMARNMVAQGEGMLTGQQKSFSWASVAASGIASPLANSANRAVFGENGIAAGTWAADKGFAGQLAQSSVAAVVSTGTRLAVVGGHVSWEDVAGDALGDALGNSLAGRSENRTKTNNPFDGVDMQNMIKNGKLTASLGGPSSQMPSWSGDGEFMSTDDPYGRVYANEYEYQNRENDIGLQPAPAISTDDLTMQRVIVIGKRLNPQVQEAPYKYLARTSLPTRASAPHTRRSTVRVATPVRPTVVAKSLAGNMYSPNGKLYANQHKYDQLILNSLSSTHDLDPLVVKSLMAQESGFNPDAKSPTGYAGLMQMGPDEARSHGLTVNGLFDERYNADKAVPAGIAELRVKMNSINTFLAQKGIFDQYNSTELMELALTAYNAGQGNVRDALKYSIEQGIAAPKLGDISYGGRNSAIGRVIPAKWGSAKVNEITNYAPQIMRRAGY